MRTIKFKAKRKSDGKWIYGIPTYDMKYMFDSDNIDSPDNYEIVPKTVCQFTGLHDKNGKEIFKGDILKIETDKPTVVGWSDKFASFVLNRSGWAFSHWFGESCNPEACEIIGNIHDNPELFNQ